MFEIYLVNFEMECNFWKAPKQTKKQQQQIVRKFRKTGSKSSINKHTRIFAGVA